MLELFENVGNFHQEMGLFENEGTEQQFFELPLRALV